MPGPKKKRKKHLCIRSKNKTTNLKEKSKKGHVEYISDTWLCVHIEAPTGEVVGEGRTLLLEDATAIARAQ